MRVSAEVLRQAYEGDDFDGVEKLLRSVSSSDAVLVLPILPYSIATNVVHADIWQRVWLARLTGSKRPNPFPDFPVVAEVDWDSVRAQFIDNFRLARTIAGAEPFEHKMNTDVVADKTLVQIGIHNAYHMGQIKLIKRAIRLSKKEEEVD